MPRYKREGKDSLAEVYANDVARDNSRGVASKGELNYIEADVSFQQAHLLVDTRDAVVLEPSLLLSEGYHLRNIYIQVVIDTTCDWWMFGTTDKGAAEGKDYVREARVNSSSVQADRDSGPADVDAWTMSLVDDSYPVGDVADASPKVVVTCCYYYSWQNTVHAADASVAMIEAAYCAVWWYTVAYNFEIAVAHVVVATVVGINRADPLVADKNFVAYW